jgi:hypothetical protein
MLNCMEKRGRNKEIKIVVQDLRFLWRSQQKSARMCLLFTSCLSIRLFAHTNSRLEEGIFMKFDIVEFHQTYRNNLISANIRQK